MYIYVYALIVKYGIEGRSRNKGRSRSSRRRIKLMMNKFLNGEINICRNEKVLGNLQISFEYRIRLGTSNKYIVLKFRIDFVRVKFNNNKI